MRSTPQNKLDPKIKSVWRLTAAVTMAVITVITLVIALIIVLTTSAIAFVVFGIAIILLTLLGILTVVIAPVFRYNRWRYEVTTTEVDMQFGYIFRTRTIIPIVRIQHVSTEQGPIMGKFNLASVTLSTAGGSHVIPGLTLEDADILRDRVAVLARIAQEDV